jgi:antitoxin HicB
MNNITPKKGAAYYLALRYPVQVRELAPEEGGGYLASIPLLGSRTFNAVGDTASEALEALEALREHLIPTLIEQGVHLAEPDDDSINIEEFSGNLVLRVPKSLHADLTRQARIEGTSINKLGTQLLSEGIGRRQPVSEVRQVLEDLSNLVRQVLETTVGESVHLGAGPPDTEVPEPTGSVSQSAAAIATNQYGLAA